MHLNRAQVVSFYSLAMSLGLGAEFDVRPWQDSSPEALVTATDPMMPGRELLFRLPVGGGSLDITETADPSPSGIAEPV